MKNRKKKTVTEPKTITELDKLNAEKHAQELLVQLEKEAKKEIEEEAKKQRQMGSKKNTTKNTIGGLGDRPLFSTGGRGRLAWSGTAGRAAQVQPEGADLSCIFWTGAKSGTADQAEAF